MKTKTHLFQACFVAFCFLISPRLSATPLNLTALSPDFMTSSLNVRFVPGSNVFSAVGITSAYLGGSVPLVGPGTYSLIAHINGAGVLNSGSLTIAGDIGAGSQTLLTGNLKTGSSGTAFGFEGPSAPAPRNTFEFLFTVTGGDPSIMSDFGGLGAADRGVILNAEFQNGGTPFNGTWTSLFFNDGHSGSAVTFVPEPGPQFLLIIGGGLLAITRRYRSLKSPR